MTRFLCLHTQERATFTPSPQSGPRALPMRTRTSWLIPAAVVCHLLLASPLVTSQLLPASPASGPLPQAPEKPSVPVTIEALQQEKNGPVYQLTGNVRILYGVYTLSADRVTYNQDSGEAQAEGHIVLEGGPNDEHIEAARGSYNLNSESGKFEQVTGTVGVKFRNKRN